MRVGQTMKIYKSANAKKVILDTYDKLLDKWDIGKEEVDIITTFGSTHVICCGDKHSKPVVLFHGVGDDSALMWLYNAKALAKHFRVFAVDTLGGPGKSHPNGNYNKSFNDITWIDEILDGLGVGKVNMVGVSHGAFLAQYYRLNRIERMLKTVCMSGSVPVGDSSSMNTMMKIFLPEALFPTKGNVVKLLRKLSGKNYQVFTDDPVVLEHYTYLLRGFNNMAMRYHKIERFTDGQIDKIRNDLLFLVGDEDPFAKLGGKSMLLKYNMNAEFFPDAGHGINHEISDIMNRRIIDFLNDKHIKD